MRTPPNEDSVESAMEPNVINLQARYGFWLEASIRVRVAAMVVAMALYVVASVYLAQAIGAAASLVAVLPVAAAGLLFGARGGVLAGIVVVHFTAFLVQFASAAVPNFSLTWQMLPGLVSLAVIGGLVGQLRASGVRLSQELVDRRTAEQEVRENDEKYRAVVENLSEGLTINIGHKRAYVNDALVRIYGLSSVEETLAAPTGDQAVEEDHQRVVDRILAMQRGEPVERTFQYRIRRPDGDLRWIESTEVPITYEGQPASLALMRDVTGQRRVETALQESEEQLRTIVESAPIGISIMDVKGYSSQSNAALQEMLGATAETLRSTPLKAFLAETDGSSGALPLDEMVAGVRDSFRTESRFHNRRGVEGWMAIAATALRDDEGRFKYAVTMAADITERKMTEQAVIASEARWRSLVENAPNTILTVTRERGILFNNRAPHDPQTMEWGGGKLFDGVPAEHQERLRATLDRVFTLGRAERYEFPYIDAAHGDTAEGAARRTAWYVYHMGPITRGDEVVAATVIMTDVTDHRNAEAAATQRSQELEAVYQVANTLVRPGPFDDKLYDVLTRLTEIVEADVVTIRVPDEDGMRAVKTVGMNGARATLIPVMLHGEGLAEKAAETGEGQVANDYPAHARALPEIIDLQIMSVAALPIKLGQERLGVMVVGSFRRDHFTPERVRLLTGVADAIGAHLENARLHAADHDRSQEMEVLFNIAGMLARPGTFEQKTAEVLAELARITHSDRVALGMPDAERRYIRFVGTAGPNAHEPSEMPLLPLDGPDVGAVAFSQGSPVIDNDYQPSLDTASDTGYEGVRSVAAVPVKGAGETLGVLTLVSHEPGHFTAQRASFLAAVGDGIGAFWENARLYQEVSSQFEESEKRIEVFRQVAGKLALEENGDQALQDLLDVVLATTGARGATLTVWDPDERLTTTITSGFGSARGAAADKKELLEMLRGVREGGLPVRVGSGDGARRSKTAYLGAPVPCKEGYSGALGLAGKADGGAFSDLDERYVGLFGVFAGILIDNLRLFEEEARERGTLTAIQSSMTEGLIVLDPHGDVRFFNRTAESLFSIRALDIEAKPFDALLVRSPGLLEGPDAADRVIQAVSEATDAPVETFVTLLHPSRRELGVTAFPIPSASGEQMTGVLLRDVTEERDLQRRRDTFVSVASHELRTPMTTILGFTELLLTREATPALRHQWLTLIQQDGQHMASIVDDMLNVSRIQSGRIRVRQDFLSLRDVVEEVLAAQQATLTGHAIVVEKLDELPDVVADREKVAQVISNLLENAVKYSPEGGKVTVVARHQPDRERIVVSVADQGIGIAPEHRRELFTTFNRIHRPETEHIRGTGLGLYIVKALVELMDGEIWLRSQVNRGSTFYFSLPTTMAQDTAA